MRARGLGDLAQMEERHQRARIGRLRVHVVGIAEHQHVVVGGNVERFERGAARRIDDAVFDLEIAAPDGEARDLVLRAPAYRRRW